MIMTKCCCISDLHGKLPQLEIDDCDLLLIAGDVCPLENEAGQNKWLDKQFIPWLKTIKIPVVMCSGNHDWPFYYNPFYLKKPSLSHVHHLQNETVTINDVTIFGTPWTLEFNNWAFNTNEAGLNKVCEKIPKDIDLILSHGPPKGYGDMAQGEHVGSSIVRAYIEIIQPKYMVYGHIHGGYGVYEHGSTKLINCSLVDDFYRTVNDPVYITV